MAVDSIEKQRKKEKKEKKEKKRLLAANGTSLKEQESLPDAHENSEQLVQAAETTGPQSKKKDKKRKHESLEGEANVVGEYTSSIVYRTLKSTLGMFADSETQKKKKKKQKVDEDSEDSSMKMAVDETTQQRQNDGETKKKKKRKHN